MLWNNKGVYLQNGNSQRGKPKKEIGYTIFSEKKHQGNLNQSEEKEE